MSKIRPEKLVAIFFLIGVSLYFITPLADSDFPWHVKTGEYIYQHREIPKTDPFSTASNGSFTEKFILSQYWLAQVVFHIVFSKTGPFGIIMLRSLIFTGIIALIWSSMEKTPLWLKTFVLYGAASVFLSYLGARPQLFSFLFAAVVIILLEKFRTTSSIGPLIVLPFVMLIWANSHGGFIFGDVIIMIAALTETIKYFFIKKSVNPLKPEMLLLLLVTILGSILASYINPNSHYAFTFSISGVGDPMATAPGSEYMSPLMATLGSSVSKAILIYWAIMGYTLVIMTINIRRVDITRLGLVFFTLLLSLTALRYVPFFVITGLILTGTYNVDFEWPGRLTALGRKTKVPVNALILLAVVLWCGMIVHSMPRKELLTNFSASSRNPTQAFTFLDREIGSANIFNISSVGSFMILRLYPKFKVFMDTRVFNPERARETAYIQYALRWDGDLCSLYDALNELLPKDYGKVKVTIGRRPASPPLREKWQDLLDRYNIEVIISRATNIHTGELLPLPFRLINMKQWKLVYADGSAMIFVRDIPRFRGLIAKYMLPKDRIFEEIGLENIPYLGTNQPGVYSGLAFALLMRGAPDKLVREYLNKARYLAPKDVLAAYIEAILSTRKAR